MEHWFKCLFFNTKCSVKCSSHRAVHYTITRSLFIYFWIFFFPSRYFSCVISRYTIYFTMWNYFFLIWNLPIFFSSQTTSSTALKEWLNHYHLPDSKSLIVWPNFWWNTPSPIGNRPANNCNCFICFSEMSRSYSCVPLQKSLRIHLMTHVWTQKLWRTRWLLT